MKLFELAFFSENVAEMTTFYRQLSEMEPTVATEDMAIFMVDGVKVFIHRLYSPSAGELPPRDHIAFQVDDVDAACKQMVGQGAILDAAPQEYYWGRSAYLRDPDGRQVELTQAAPTHETERE
jgi:catechol 2,3-dioxygenase-like lactoylglutathione lyase family enzyme